MIQNHVIDGTCRSGSSGHEEPAVIFSTILLPRWPPRQKSYHMMGVFQDHNVRADRPRSEEEGCLGPAYPQCPTNMKVKVVVTQPCPALCKPMDCSLPGSSVYGIFPARLLEWVAMPSSRGIFMTQGSNPRLLWLLPCRQILYR